MVKKRKSKSTRRRRTAQEIEEEQSRTLYIRLPKTIKSPEEIKPLFVGNFHVKLPRQSGRYCHVIFPTIEDKVKNLKQVKKKIVHDKPVFACDPRPINLEKPKKPKKIKIPEPTQEPKISKYLFISNIPAGTKASEVKDAFPGAITVALLKGLFINGTKQAKVKMCQSHLCEQYIKNKKLWPTIKGKKVNVQLGKNSKGRRGKLSKNLKTDEDDDDDNEEDEITDNDAEKESNNGSDQEEEEDEEEVESSQE